MPALDAAWRGAPEVIDDWRRVDPLDLPPLLDAASKAFFENGFHGTTVRDVLSRAGVTAPTLYYHYGNKDGLLLALLELSTRGMVARIVAAKDEAGEDPVQQLRNVIEAIVAPMTITPRIAALEGEVRYLPADARRRYRASRRAIEDHALAVVEEGAVRGVFSVSDAKETTRAVMAMCQAIPRWYNPGETLTPESVVDKYIDIALNTVGYRRETHR